MIRLYKKYTLFFLGAFTLIAFPLLSWIIMFIIPNSYQVSFDTLFQIHKSDYGLIPLFLSLGIVFGLVVIWLTELDYFEKSMQKYKNLLGDYKLTVFYVFFLSICAGVGEEIFFRGVVQPVIGVWLTALFFVAIHGYFSIKNKRINIFALLLTCFIALIGWSAKEYSIWLAIAAHFSYDLVLLFYYRSTNEN
jgi:membrane protease YdiL (CAAX protease family)